MNDESDFEHNSHNMMIHSCGLFIDAKQRAIDAHAKGRLNQSMEWLEIAAMIAAEFHPGFFADGDCEGLLWAIGDSIPKRKRNDVSAWARDDSNDRRDKLNVFHVMTTAYSTGGHTRVVARWIENCQSSDMRFVQSVVATNQSNGSIPQWLASVARESGGDFHELNAYLPPLDRALRLREMVSAKADMVVLHIHPMDAVPGVAFAFADRQFPVLFFNHADHRFCLGTSVADVILDFRAIGREISETERACKGKVMTLPIPLVDPIAGTRERDDRDFLRTAARQRLGISPSTRLILTICNEGKLKPALGLDFKRAAASILEKVNAAQVFAVGIPDSGEWQALNRNTNGRFHPLGVITDIKTMADLYWSSDLYLVGIPLGSVTAMLDAGLYELPIQRMVSPIAPITSGDDISLERSVPFAATEGEYVDGAVKLLDLPSAERNRIGRELRTRILEDHCSASWVGKWLKPTIERAIVDRPKAKSDKVILPRTANYTTSIPTDLGIHYSALALSLAGPIECMILASLCSSSHMSFTTKSACLSWSLSNLEMLRSRRAMLYLAKGSLNLVLPPSLYRAILDGIQRRLGSAFKSI